MASTPKTLPANFAGFDPLVKGKAPDALPADFSGFDEAPERITLVPAHVPSPPTAAIEAPEDATDLERQYFERIGVWKPRAPVDAVLAPTQPKPPAGFDETYPTLSKGLNVVSGIGEKVAAIPGALAEAKRRADEAEETALQARIAAGPEIASRILEPVRMEEIERIPGLEPGRVEALKPGQEPKLYSPEVVARAAAKTITDWYSPAVQALRVFGVGTARAGERAAALKGEAKNLWDASVRNAQTAAQLRNAGRVAEARQAAEAANQGFEKVFGMRKEWANAQRLANALRAANAGIAGSFTVDYIARGIEDAKAGRKTAAAGDAVGALGSLIFVGAGARGLSRWPRRVAQGEIPPRIEISPEQIGARPEVTPPRAAPSAQPPPAPEVGAARLPIVREVTPPVRERAPQRPGAGEPPAPVEGQPVAPPLPARGAEARPEAPAEAHKPAQEPPAGVQGKVVAIDAKTGLPIVDREAVGVPEVPQVKAQVPQVAPPAAPEPKPTGAAPAAQSVPTKEGQEKLYWGIDHQDNPVVATMQDFRDGGWRLYTKQEVQELLGLPPEEMKVSKWLYRKEVPQKPTAQAPAPRPAPTEPEAIQEGAPTPAEAPQGQPEAKPPEPVEKRTEVEGLPIHEQPSKAAEGMAKRLIEEAGANYQGFQMGSGKVSDQFLFTDPQTKSTLAVAVEDITKPRVLQAKLAESRAKFAPAKEAPRVKPEAAPEGVSWKKAKIIPTRAGVVAVPISEEAKPSPQAEKGRLTDESLRLVKRGDELVFFRPNGTSDRAMVSAIGAGDPPRTFHTSKGVVPSESVFSVVALGKRKPAVPFVGKKAEPTQEGVKAEKPLATGKLGVPFVPKPKAEESQAAESRVPVLIDRFEQAIRDKTMPTDPRDVREMAKQVVAGDPAQYVDDIYDSLEGATNRVLREERKGDLGERIQTAAKFEDALGRRTRTLEITKRQQFSTPLPIAEGVAYSSDVQRGDVILEPTAGTGNLIEPFVEPNGYRNGASVKAIEIEPRRAEVLRANGFDTEETDYIRTKEKADVIVTNPPWGKISTGRYRHLDIPAPWGKYGDVSERFIVKNLNDLNEGGRVAALMPTTVLSANSIGFRNWLEKNHTVRAWIQSPPGAYTRRGTDVESILLVVDKGKIREAVPPIRALDTAVPKDYGEYAEAIQPLAEGGSHARNATAKPAVERPAETTLGTGTPVRPETPVSERPRAGGGLPAGRPVRQGAGELRPASTGASPNVVPTPPAGRGEVPESAGTPELVRQSTPALRPEGVAPERLAEFDAATSSPVFAPYAVRSGARGTPHPRQVVETRTLAGAPSPKLTYKPSSGVMEAHDQGVLSDEQVDVVAAVGQANRNGHAMMVADDVGLGKSREIGARAMDLIEQEGRKRILITSKGEVNLRDLEQELKILWNVAADATLPVRYEYLRNYPQSSERSGPNKKEWQALPTFDEPTLYVVEAGNVNAFSHAISNLSVDAVLADEVHSYKNIEGAQVGRAWRTLHREWLDRKVPISYYSATPATMVDELEYLYGLREWTLDGFADWVMLRTGRATEEDLRRARENQEPSEGPTQVPSVGTDATDLSPVSGRPVFRRGDIFSAPLSTAEMEQIMRELKMRGKYLARDLWRGGVEFSQVDKPLTPEEKDRYGRLVRFMRDVEAAWWKYQRMNQNKNSFGPSSQLQFHAKRALFDMRLDRAIEEGKQALARGEQVVISLISVSEVKEGEGNLASVIRGINIDHVLVDPDTGEVEELGEIPEAIAERNELLERYRAEVPESPDPIEKIRKAFGGKGKVASVTGEETAKQRRAEMELFQGGQKKVIVISGAGKTGINLHHIKNLKEGAKGQRHLIVADYEWSATNFKQELGRVDRAGQLTSPKVSMLTMGMAGEKKFVATIANRLKSQGAVSKGAGESGTAEPLEHYEIGGDYDNLAMRETWRDLPRELKSLFRGSKFMERMRDGSLSPRPMVTEATVKDFMLQLQLIPVDEGNEIWNAFWETRERLLTGENAEERQLRKTQKSTGTIARTHELQPDLTLYEVKDAAGHRAGILVGMITDKMGVLRRFITPEGATSPKREYVTFRAKDGSQLSGLRIPPSEIKPLALAFGKKIAYKHTAGSAFADLQAGDKIPLANGWELRVGKAGERAGYIVIEGAKLSNTERGKTILSHGAAYNAVSGGFFHLGKLDADNAPQRIDKFLERFPIKIETVEEKPARRESGAEPGFFGAAETLPTAAVGKPAIQPPQRGFLTRLFHPEPTPKRRSELLNDVLKVLDVPARVGRYRKKALGIFKVRPEVIRTRLAHDIPVIAHELGHDLHKLWWGTTPKGRLLAKPLRKFLSELGPLATKGTKSTEGYAEFIRLYLTNPSEAEAKAPKFLEFFEGKLDEAENQSIREAVGQAREDIRRYVELSPTEKVELDIAFERKGNFPELGEIGDQLWSAVTDKFHPAARFIRSVYGVKNHEDVPVEDNTYILARVNSHNSQDIADRFIRKGGPIDWNSGEPTGDRALMEIYKAVVRNWDTFRKFNGYAYAKTALDRLTFKPDMLLPQIRELYEAAVKEYEARHPEFKKVLEEGVRTEQAALAYYSDSGALPSGSFQEIVARHPNHFPLYRLMEGIEPGDEKSIVGSGFARVPNPVKRAKGGGEEILPPLVNQMLNIVALINAAQRYEVQKSLLKASKQEGAGQFVTEVDPKIAPVSFPLERIKRQLEAGTGLTIDDQTAEMVLTVFRPSFFERDPRYIVVREPGGTKQHVLEFQDREFMRAMGGIRPEEMGGVVKLLSVAKRLLRAGVTLPVEFWIRNAPRDQQEASALAKKTKISIFGRKVPLYIPGYHFVSGLWSILKKSKGAYDAVTFGLGRSSLIGADQESLKRYVFDQMALSLPARQLFLHPVELANYLVGRLTAPLEYASNFVELASRLPEYEAAVKELQEKGEPLDRHAKTLGVYHGSNLTVDFWNMGWAVKSLGAMSAFFTAGIGGTRRIVETAYRRPFAFFSRGILWMMLPAMLLYWLNRKKKRYWQEPEFKRDGLYYIPNPFYTEGSDEHEWYTLPKAWGTGWLFGTLPETIFSYLEGKEFDTAQRLWASFEKAFIPNPVPTVAVAVQHQLQNKDAFGRPIVSPSVERLEPPYQTGRYTPDVWNRVGKATNQSPARIQAMWRDLTGNMGMWAEEAMSAGTTRLAGEETPSQPSKPLGRYPVFRAFVHVPPGFQAEPLRRMYAQRKKLERQSATAFSFFGGKEKANQLLQVGRFKSEFQRLSTEDRELFRKALRTEDELKRLRQASQAINQARDAYEQIRTNRTLSSAAKRQRMNTIEQRVVEIARRALASANPPTPSKPTARPVPFLSRYKPGTQPSP